MKKKLLIILACLLAVTGIIYAVTSCSAANAAKQTAIATRNPNILPQEPLQTPESACKEVTVHFIDVGHGDCELIQAGGEFMLIDTGVPRHAKRVIDYLKQCGVQELARVLITHQHIDHIGGLADIIEAFPIKELIMTDAVSDDPAYAAAMEVIAKKNIPVVRPRVGERFHVGSAVMTVLAPNQGSYVNFNNTSIVTRLVFGDTSFLFTGDASAVSEQEMLANLPVLPLRSTVLKVGHHGGDSSTSQAFLDAVQPLYAVISCPSTEPKQFPDPAVLERLKAKGVKVYRTDESGTVTFISDGKTLRID